MTLLEKAKAAKPPKSRNFGITDEHIDLAIAWAKGEVKYMQVLEALFGERKGSMQAYVVLARSLREAVKEGKLKQ